MRRAPLFAVMERVATTNSTPIVTLSYVATLTVSPTFAADKHGAKRSTVEH
jgi:hypothetical protein